MLQNNVAELLGLLVNTNQLLRRKCHVRYDKATKIRKGCA